MAASFQRNMREEMIKLNTSAVHKRHKQWLAWGGDGYLQCGEVRGVIVMRSSESGRQTAARVNSVQRIYMRRGLACSADSRMWNMYR